jgi:hypothetical protein
MICQLEFRSPGGIGQQRAQTAPAGPENLNDGLGEQPSDAGASSARGVAAGLGRPFRPGNNEFMISLGEINSL